MAHLPRGTAHAFACLLPLLCHAAVAGAQGVELGVDHTGVAIGNVPRFTGLRLNFRDRGLQQLTGVNVTIWNPYEPMTGTVEGVALGVPVTGAGRISGLAVGLFGVGAADRMEGIGVGGLGLGAGRRMSGLMVGGLGVGTGGDLTGIALGGAGVGGGGGVRGLTIGGLGVGAGGSIRGLSIGGLGVGAGGDITGISIAGAGVGAGGKLEGLAIGGLGVGAPELEGIVLAGLGAGANTATAGVLAPAYFMIDEGGTFTGGSLSFFNRIRGTQHGLTIGVINYARELHGVQLGLINILDRPGGRRVLPLIDFAP